MAGGEEKRSVDSVPLSDIPRDVLDDACERVSHFSIGLVRVEHGAEKLTDLAGSGTLVRVGEAHGILTAGHVLHHLRKENEIGLLLARLGQPILHRPEWQPRLIRLRPEALNRRLPAEFEYLSNLGRAVLLDGDPVPGALGVLYPIVARDLGPANLFEPARLGSVATRNHLEASAFFLLRYRDRRLLTREAGAAGKNKDQHSGDHMVAPW